MKKVCSLFLTALIALPLLRCTRDEPAPAPDALQEITDYFDPSEARDHFLQTQRRIWAQHAPDTVGLLPVGTVIPHWEAARPSRNKYLASLDIPVSSPYRYTLLARTDDGGTYPIELLLRLVSIKTPPEDRIAEYLLLFVPDLDYDIRNRGERPWAGCSTAEICRISPACCSIPPSTACLSAPPDSAGVDARQPPLSGIRHGHRSRTSNGFSASSAR